MRILAILALLGFMEPLLPTIHGGDLDPNFETPTNIPGAPASIKAIASGAVSLIQASSNSNKDSRVALRVSVDCVF
jgi:hypothetical protein